MLVLQGVFRTTPFTCSIRKAVANWKSWCTPNQRVHIRGGLSEINLDVLPRMKSGSGRAAKGVGNR